MTASWALRNPVLPLVVITLLAVFGLRAGFQLPLTHLPDIGENRIVIRLAAHGATLAGTDRELAQPLEEALVSLPEVSSVQSEISAGELLLTLSLRNSRQSQKTLALVSDRIQSVISELQVGAVQSEIRALSSRRQPTLAFLVVPRDGDLVAASDAMTRMIRPVLTRVAGLGDIEVKGDRQAGLTVRPDPARLAAVDITPGDFTRQLAAALENHAARQTPGADDAGGVLLGVVQPGSAADARDLKVLPLSTAGGQMVPLAAVADVVSEAMPGDWTVRSDGAPALFVQLFPDETADLRTILEQVDDSLALLATELPELEFRVVDRPADRALASLDATTRTLLEGCLLVIAVIALTLRDGRATVLAALALPLSMLPTLYVMQVFGLSLNMVSLLALTLASGILVDDAIVEIENIDKHLRKHADPARAVDHAMREIALPVVGTSLAVLAVFLPVATMPGEAGRYFWAFGATLCIATVFSLLVSRLVIPPLAVSLMSTRPARVPSEALHRLAARYETLVRRALRFRWVCLGVAVVITGLSVVGLMRHPGSFIPEDRTQIVRLDLDMPPLMDAEERGRHLARLDADLEGLDGVRSVGSVLSEDPGRPVRLLVQTDGTARTESLIRQTVAVYPDMRANVLKTTGQPKLALDLAAPDLSMLEAALPAVMRALAGPSGNSAQWMASNAKHPELRFVPDPETLRQLGLGSAELRDTVQTLTEPRDTITALIERDGQRALPIRIDLRGTGEEFTVLHLPEGGIVPLSAVGRFELALSHQRLERRDGLYVLTLVADPATSAEAAVLARAAGDAVSALAQDMPGLVLLPRGDLVARQEMMRDLSTAAVSMLVLMAAVLFVLFRSAGQMVVIVASLLFSLVGGLLVLKITGLPVSLPVMIGMLLLFGIVAKNAILLVEKSQRIYRQSGDFAQAMLLATRDRARPILMTSVAMMAGMAPAALPGIEGGAFRQPLALTVIGGVAVSTVLSLVLVPAMSMIAHDIGTVARRNLRRAFALASGDAGGRNFATGP